MERAMKHTISILLENEAGALSRVVGLFSARGYNIETLTVAPTENVWPMVPAGKGLSEMLLGSEDL